MYFKDLFLLFAAYLKDVSEINIGTTVQSYSD